MPLSGGARETKTVANFFPMSRGDLAYVVIIISVAVIAFLPWAREIHFAGVALVGWLMALLMVISPVIALVRIAQERRHQDGEEEP
jgi:hypothetical protein